MNDLWEKIVYDLQGSCDSLFQVLEEHEAQHLEDDMPFLEYLDMHIFCCESCNWWSPVSEMGESLYGPTCLDCEDSSWD